MSSIVNMSKLVGKLPLQAVRSNCRSISHRHNRLYTCSTSGISASPPTTSSSSSSKFQIITNRALSSYHGYISANNMRFMTTKRNFSSYPPHKVVPMPALSPTMESGSIVKWLLKEGDAFEAGTAICEVETDKATVTNEATEDGFIAKILVGTGEVKVGQPLMITVDDKSEVAAFANYSSAAATPASTPTPSPTPAKTTPPPTPTPAVTPSAAPAAASSPVTAGQRVVASPYARKLARDHSLPIEMISGTGPQGRIIAEDVLLAQKTGIQAPAVVPAVAPVTPAAKPPAPVGKITTGGIPGVYQDFELSDIALAVATRQTQAKQFIPHYYLSIDLNLEKLLKLRAALNKSSSSGVQISVLDFFVKASALAMKKVPDANASWMDTYIRRYHQVDVNVVVDGADGLVTPVVRDAGSVGLKHIAQELSSFESDSSSGGEGGDVSTIQLGTFAIHDLGKYGVKSAAPIIISPQCCALAIGSITDTVIPRTSSDSSEDNWQVASVVTVTLSCDHRVVDGAVGAQWLAALKTLIEEPINMIL